MSRLIYLDNAATTQVYPEVVDASLLYRALRQSISYIQLCR